MKTARIALGALCLSAAAAAPAAAPRGGARDVLCATIERLPSGGFTYQARPGLSILALARGDGPFTFEHDGSVVGFACLRSGGLPDVDEVEVLQAGYSLTVSEGPSPMVELELKNGRVASETLNGTLAPGDRRRLAAIVAAMQARVDAAAAR